MLRLSPKKTFALTALRSVLAFTIKVAGFIWFFMLIRWTLPRFRYDQILKLGWRYMFPIALANVFITAVVLLFLV